MKILSLLFCLSWITACNKWEGIPIEFHDPQDIMFLEEVLPIELIHAFGEENIHFGPAPPNLNDITFKTEGMDYDTCIRYIFGPNGETMLSPTAPPTYDGTLYYYHLWNHQEQLSSHKLKTVDPSGNTFIRTNDSTYVIGHDSAFTAYYQETILEPHSGNPTNYIIISGIVLRDPTTDEFIGIKHYRMGKMIKCYDHQPEIPSYAPGTLEVKRHDALCPRYVWDTIQNRHPL